MEQYQRIPQHQYEEVENIVTEYNENEEENGAVGAPAWQPKPKPSMKMLCSDWNQSARIVAA